MRQTISPNLHDLLRHGRDAPDHLLRLHDLLRHGCDAPDLPPQLNDLLRHGRAAPDHLPQLPDIWDPAAELEKAPEPMLELDHI